MKSILTISVIVIIFVLFIGLVVSMPDMPEPTGYESYVVQPGDTLWGIAHQSDGWNKYDGHEIIDDICERSDCTATIYPGQVIYIPMYSE